ncbi:MAG: sensor domain-containing diguanylate cyclase [Nitriliruptoraceae bacterium]|nr:sensor domain-containing diguanylate cyclase [Nitriliruptoraceae bacterium]
MSDARRDEQLWALAETGPRLAACRSIDELTEVGVELARSVVQASAASIARIEHERGLLRVLRNTGQLADWEEEAPEDETYELADFPLLSATAEGARPWFGHLGDPASPAGDAHQELLAAMGMATSISIPIVVGQKVWGELGASRVADLPRYDAIDVAAGQSFAALFAASIQRIQEESELHELAFLDALTGLGNRRALDLRLEQEFSRRLDPVRSIAIVLCDVDGLKRINDLSGHDGGDLVLREVATRISAVAGAYPDSLGARLGGDEFALVLVGLEDAEVAEIAQSLSDGAHDLPLGAGLSCGWASNPRTSVDPDDAMRQARGLLRLADAAQYRAKRLGRGTGRQMGGQPSPEMDGARLAARVTRVATTKLSGVVDVLERLETLVTACCDVFDASAGSVSISVDGGPLVVVSNVANDRLSDPGRQSVEPGATYGLDEFPASRAALGGGAFHADLEAGDGAERGFLATNGHDEMIAAGYRQDERVAWLVEVFGDAMSVPLAAYTSLLEALVALAVEAGAPATPEEIAARLPDGVVLV